MPTRVLVVDDDQLTREYLAQVLRSDGLLTAEAATGAEALMQAVDGVDVIVLDVILPDLNGLEVCRRLKADPATSDTPVIQLSGLRVTSDDRAAGLEGGADAYLVKPVEPRELIAHVRSLARAHRAERAARSAAVQWQATFDAVPDGIGVVDSAGRLTRCNVRLADYLGRPIDELVGAHYDTAVCSAADEIQPAAAEVNVGGRWFRVHRRDVHGPRASAVIVWTDVTDSKRARDALQESEERLRLAVDAAQLGAWDWDMVGGRIAWTPWHERLFGIPEGSFRGTYREFEERVHPDDLDALNRAVAGARDGRTPYAHDFRVVRPGGKVRWIAGRGRFYYDDVGRPIRMRGVVMDVTDRKRAEQVRQLQSQFLELTHDAVIATDLAGVITGWNRGAERLYGYRPDEMVGHHVVLLYPEADRATKPAEVIGAVRERGSHELEMRVRRKTGEVIEVHLSMALVHGVDGEPAGIVGYSIDVTDRRRTELARQWMAAIVESSADAIIAVDLDGTITGWNPAAERIYGYGAREALGRNIAMLAPPDRAGEAREILARMRSGGGAVPLETLRLRKDRTPVHVSVTVSPVRDTAGAVVGASAIARDVGERRSLEDQLRQSQKMEAIGLLAGGVAHDFNNLLTVITGYCDLLLYGLSREDPSHHHVQEIRKAGDRAAGLTRQLLAFSRKQVLRPQVLDLNAVVADTEKMLRRLIGEDVHLVTYLDPALGPVLADPGQIEQVLMNLAINARDAMPSGGRLTVETRPAELDESYVKARLDVRPGTYALLAVSDSGTGMTPEVKARVFEPFFTTKEVGRGTGLGLATVHGIVKQSGGHIEVYSEPGHGTTFKIYLPLAERPAAAATAAEVRPANGSETVLLAEDEDGVRSLASTALSAHGYNVLEARDGREALDRAMRHTGPIHILVTDVVMPHVSGRQLADRLVAAHPGLRVLYMSGYADEAVVRHGVLENGTAFLQKPFAPAGLAAKVREVLDA